MDVAGLLIESFGRVDGVLTRAVDGLSVDELTFRPDPAANSIAWLAWHAARGEDAQIADVAGSEQVWTSQGWADRFDLPFDDSATGYGHSAQDVGRVRASSELLLAYVRAVADRTQDYLGRTRRGRPRPGGRRTLGPAGDARRPAGEHRRRQPPARGPGGVRAGLLERSTRA